MKKTTITKKVMNETTKPAPKAAAKQAKKPVGKPTGKCGKCGKRE